MNKPLKLKKKSYVCNLVSNKKLHKLITIRPFLAALVLCVFSLALTPKRLLHNLVADHKDTSCKILAKEKIHLSNAGVNCPCDNIVALSPFEEVDIMPVLTAPIFFIKHEKEYVNPHFHSIHYFFELRGPPAVYPI